MKRNSALSGIEFSNYDQVPVAQKLTSDSHSIVVTGTYTEFLPQISGGPLDGEYVLHSAHFHWGVDDLQGSEHIINNRSYPMEMHAVHTKGGIPLDEAKQTKDGIAVIGYFIDVSVATSNAYNPFTAMTETINELTKTKEAIDMAKKFAMSKLAIPFEWDYMTYEGSLTTDDCNEVVTWLLAPRVLKISPEQIQIFRDLFDRNMVEDPSNYRFPQGMNGRKVTFVPRPLEANPPGPY